VTVYFAGSDLPQRAGVPLGCHFASTSTADADGPWNSTYAVLDAGNLVKMGGPEDSSAYAYTHSDDGDASIEVRGGGGPTLTGKVLWGKLSAWVRERVVLGGPAYTASWGEPRNRLPRGA
jgi:hypothetical protein